MLDKAIAIAVQAHKGQVDETGAPYILHPLRVMLSRTAEEERILGVLHDVLDTSAYTMEDLKKEGFSESLLSALDCITRRDGESYTEFIERVMENRTAAQVKLAALHDHIGILRQSYPGDEDYKRSERYYKAAERIAGFLNENYSEITSKNGRPADRQTTVSSVKSIYEKLNFNAWQAPCFTEAASLRAFLEMQNQFIGESVSCLWTRGCIFNETEILNGRDYGFLELNQPVSIRIGHTNLEVWFRTDSRVKIGMDTLPKPENTQGWTDQSMQFGKDIIGQKIVGFNVKTTSRGFYDSLDLCERPDGGDYFDYFSLILENGKRLVFTGSSEYMQVFVGNKRNRWLYQRDSKLIESKKELKQSASEYFQFRAGRAQEYKEGNSAFILEVDFLMLLTAVFAVVPNFDIYHETVIDKNDWEKILDCWGLYFFSGSFEEVMEKMCQSGPGKYNDKNSPAFFMLKMHGKNLWETKGLYRGLFYAFENWVTRQLDTENCITLYGVPGKKDFK